ncbi:hypothetical protein K491DRAFT_598143 [Lophiostoma macrostomum CBS 122681]|uniref:Uncharacterized protein n=1 Tax=Lophiostoma macrostomum CBS 122681 TaxID=1314788 RepID=A0A6A6T6X7_9PLEO|nr:hypothetical protein K491DRAFT_598143 [Lophiostoma macrostomum CBS 122681]
MGIARPLYPVWTALIRTHHITSRAKVNKLRTAAGKHDIYALLCSGGCPGIMYCEGSMHGVTDWVKAVQRLRYKDFQLAIKPALDPERVAVLKKENEEKTGLPFGTNLGKLEEVDSVKEFGARMQEMGVWTWWRKGMGYVQGD